MSAVLPLPVAGKIRGCFWVMVDINIVYTSDRHHCAEGSVGRAVKLAVWCIDGQPQKGPFLFRVGTLSAWSNYHRSLQFHSFVKRNRDVGGVSWCGAYGTTLSDISWDHVNKGLFSLVKWWDSWLHQQQAAHGFATLNSSKRCTAVQLKQNIFALTIFCN